ncbi:MAG TPA: response regulator [Ktedonobacteraceae bacterium]
MSGETILVVEDNPSNMKLVKAILLSEGYEVHLAEDAEVAQIKLATLHPQLILMDIQLPGMDGLTLTRLLKADPHTRDILIVALTAYAMKGDQQKALDAGCDAYIAKPIDRLSFLGSIRQYLDAITSSAKESGRTSQSQV